MKARITLYGDKQKQGNVDNTDLIPLIEAILPLLQECQERIGPCKIQEVALSLPRDKEETGGRSLIIDFPTLVEIDGETQDFLNSLVKEKRINSWRFPRFYPENQA